MKCTVSVIIVHWNTPERLQSLLRSLGGNQYPLEIIVVDNASSTSLSSLKKKFSHVIWIENSINYGYAFACNQGTQKSSSARLLFLNPDISISPSTIRKMYHYSISHQLDALSQDFDDNSYKKPVPTLLSLIHEFSPIGKVIPSSVFSTRTLVGGCLMIKKSVLQELGGWDERFYFWFEDSDLTKRLLNAQKKIGFYAFEISHIGGESFKRLDYQKLRDVFFNSMYIYADKHFSYLQLLILKLIKQRYSNKYILPAMNEGITLVIPNVRRELLIDFLEMNFKFIKKHHIVCVTSGCSIKQLWQLRETYPTIRFILQEHNRGFAHTVNVGFRVATTPILGTINDDVILNTHTVPHLLYYAPSIFGSLNPLVYNMDGSMESAGVTVLKKGKAIPNQAVSTKIRSQVDATNAAMVIYSRDALDKVGIYDEVFGSYLEDVDLSLRLSRSGWKNYVINKSRLIHIKHQTSKRYGRFKNVLDFKNWILVVIKNWSISDLLVHAPMILLERAKNFYGILK